MIKKCNYKSVNVGYFYLAIIPFGANLSIHVLLIQWGWDAEAVAHTKSLRSPIVMANFDGSVQNDIPVVQLQTEG